MALALPSSAGFAQSVCQRRRALDPRTPLVVVEGATDRRALLPFLGPQVVVVPARGRPNAIAAHERSNGEGLTGVLFMIDCDGSVPSHLKGLPDLIISANRDLESDLLLELDALRRYALDVLADISTIRSDAESRIDRLLTRAAAVSAGLERVRRAARAMNVPTRFIDPITGQRRKVAAHDLPHGQSWMAADSPPPELEDIALAYQVVAGWSQLELATVMTEVSRNSASPCARHGAAGCTICETRALCVGHDLVEFVTQGLRLETGIDLEVYEVDRGIRVSSDRSLVSRWCVSTRGRRWADSHGLQLFS